jgi:hypothetical protein
MKFTAPHWLTMLFGFVALIAGSLAQTNAIPAWTPWFAVIAAMNVAAALPTISKPAPLIPVTIVETDSK